MKIIKADPKDNRAYIQKSIKELKDDLKTIDLTIENINKKIKTLESKKPEYLNWKVSTLKYKIYDCKLTKKFIYEMIAYKKTI